MSNTKATVKGKKLKTENTTVTENKSELPLNENKPTSSAPVRKTDYVEPTYGNEEIDYDDVYDEADIASALEMGFIAKALADHKTKVAPESHPDFDGEHCIDCDAEIPEVRLNMGKIRCVDCQSELELRNKLKGRK